MDIRHLWRGKSRGVTPVVATVLLIGLVAIAGIAIALVIFGTINSPPPIEVRILSISDFETTDTNTLIDQFSVTLHNVERTNLRLEVDSFTLEYKNGTMIPGWGMDPKQSEIYLSARTIETIPLICDPIAGIELPPDQDAIYIEVTVFPKDSTSQRSARTFRSNLLLIGSTHGPIFLEYQATTLNLVDTGLKINFITINNGSKDQSFKLELYTNSPENITFTIGNINRTTVLFSIAGYNTTTINVTVFPTDRVTVGDSYIVVAFLWRQSDLQLVSSVSFVLTY
ncbi:MAG: hypothetical protein ACFFB5_06800 [Promethearchaeota archaeon]